MLFMSSANKITRIHAPYVTEGEIEKVNNFLRSQAEPEYVKEILEFSEASTAEADGDEMNDKDELYQNAVQLVRNEGKASHPFCKGNCKLVITIRQNNRHDGRKRCS